MGLTDREAVCLIVLGHQYGRCHPEVSGYQFPWYSFDPSHWNIYEHGLGFLTAFLMASDGRSHREELNASGKRQYNAHLFGGEPFMMLPSDMALVWDPQFRSHLEYYDRDRRAFRIDAAATFKKLTELGCPHGLLTPETTAEPDAHSSHHSGAKKRRPGS